MAQDRQSARWTRASALVDKVCAHAGDPQLVAAVLIRLVGLSLGCFHPILLRIAPEIVHVRDPERTSHDGWRTHPSPRSSSREKRGKRGRSPRLLSRAGRTTAPALRRCSLRKRVRRRCCCRLVLPPLLPMFCTTSFTTPFSTRYPSSRDRPSPVSPSTGRPTSNASSSAPSVTSCKSCTPSMVSHLFDSLTNPCLSSARLALT